MRIDTFVDNVLDQLKDFLPAGTPVHFELNVLTGRRRDDGCAIIYLDSSDTTKHQRLSFDVTISKDHTLSRPAVG